MSNLLDNILQATKDAIDNHIMPVDDGETKDPEPIVPTDTLLNPPEESINPPPSHPLPPPTDAIIPPTDAIIPPTDAIIPPTDAILPPNDAILPPTHAIIPPTHAIIPHTDPLQQPHADTPKANGHAPLAPQPHPLDAELKDGEPLPLEGGVKREGEDNLLDEKPSKKPKTDTTPSKEGPMGELRPTDVLAGNYRKRSGNFLYKKLLRDYAHEVGNVEMRTIVAKVVDGVAAQVPPGRFIREGGDAILSRAQTNQKVARALREVHERSQKEGEGAKTPDGKPVVKKAKTITDKQEPLGEIRPSDVLTGNYRKRPGNHLYKTLLRDHAPAVADTEMRTVVNRVIEGIYGQNPPGRFIREGGGGLLTRGQVHQKVARALREVVERSTGDGEKQAAEKAAKKAKQVAETKDEPMGEIRPTDVLTGNYRKRPGNFLFKKLLREHALSVGQEEMSIVVARVIDGISAQEPPGRFIREGGGSLLTRGQVRQKVARALREVVERTKNPDKDKKPPPITAADALAADAARKKAAADAARAVEEAVKAAEEATKALEAASEPIKTEVPPKEEEKVEPVTEEVKEEAVQEEAVQEETVKEETVKEEEKVEPSPEAPPAPIVEEEAMEEVAEGAGEKVEPAPEAPLEEEAKEEEDAKSTRPTRGGAAEEAPPSPTRKSSRRGAPETKEEEEPPKQTRSSRR